MQTGSSCTREKGQGLTACDGGRGCLGAPHHIIKQFAAAHSSPERGKAWGHANVQVLHCRHGDRHALDIHACTAQSPDQPPVRAFMQCDLTITLKQCYSSDVSDLTESHLLFSCNCLPSCSAQLPKRPVSLPSTTTPSPQILCPSPLRSATAAKPPGRPLPQPPPPSLPH